MSSLAGGLSARKIACASAEAPPTKPDFYIDKLALRTARPLSLERIGWLLDNCATAGQELGNDIIRGPHKAKRWLITVSVPNRAALEFFAQRRGLLVNAFEATIDFLTPDRDTAKAVSLFLRDHIVHRWHGRHRLVDEEHGWYSGQKDRPGAIFKSYWDDVAKLRGGPCCRFERAHQGAAACRRAGIEHTRDLLDFPFEQFWQKHLILREVDLSALGRSHLNKLEKAQRRKPRVEQFGRIKFDIDRRVGSTLMRAFGFNPRMPAPYGEDRGLALQWLLDRYKHGDGDRHGFEGMGVPIKPSVLLPASIHSSCSYRQTLQIISSLCHLHPMALDSEKIPSSPAMIPKASSPAA